MLTAATSSHEPRGSGTDGRQNRRNGIKEEGNVMGTQQRVIAILGAGGALGGAISRQLASESLAGLVLSDVNATSLDGTIGAISDSGVPFETALADVSDFQQVEAVVARTVERFGRLDVLVSNAGVLS